MSMNISMSNGPKASDSVPVFHWSIHVQKLAN